MDDSIKENGWTTTCTEVVFTRGRTVESTKVNTRTIRNTDSVFIPGPMEGDTRDSGPVENNTVSAPTLSHSRKLNVAFGKKENASNGLTILKSQI